MVVDSSMRRAFCVLLGALISSSCFGSHQQAVYRNEEFGITLNVPAGALLCTQPADQHDHGPHMLLGTHDKKTCGEFQHTRYIDVFGS